MLVAAIAWSHLRRCDVNVFCYSIGLPKSRKNRRFPLRRDSSSSTIKCPYPERIPSDGLLCDPPFLFSDFGLDPAEDPGAGDDEAKEWHR
jgi:hypothetical protein